MRDIEIGIRIDQHRGLEFFGAEELNELIQRGGRVAAIEPGGAIMHKLGEEGDQVRVTLGGFSLKARCEEP